MNKYIKYFFNTVKMLPDKLLLLLRGKPPFFRIFSFNWLFTRHIVKSYKKHISLFNEKIVCDYGAGSAPYFVLVKDIVQKYYALDFYDQNEEGALLTKITLEKGGKIPNDFTVKPDTIISNQVLVETYDPFFYLDEIEKISQIGTHLFLTTPFLQTAGYQDKLRISPFFLNKLLRERGFEVVMYKPAGHFFNGIGLSFNMALVLKNKYDWQSGSANISKAKSILFSPIIAIVNILSVILDWLFPLYRVPSNFLIVAKKISE